jgi:hypothetical protein
VWNETGTGRVCSEISPTHGSTEITCEVVKAPWMGLATCVDLETTCYGAHLRSVQDVGVPVTLHSLDAIRGLKFYSEGHNLDGRGLAGNARFGREGPCRGRLAEGAGVANHHVTVTGWFEMGLALCTPHVALCLL